MNGGPNFQQPGDAFAGIDAAEKRKNEFLFFSYRLIPFALEVTEMYAVWIDADFIGRNALGDVAVFGKRRSRYNVGGLLHFGLFELQEGFAFGGELLLPLRVLLPQLGIDGFFEAGMGDAGIKHKGFLPLRCPLCQYPGAGIKANNAVGCLQQVIGQLLLKALVALVEDAFCIAAFAHLAQALVFGAPLAV